ncbi:hypothetical protein Q3318_18480 [Clostridioides difficile]
MYGGMDRRYLLSMFAVTSWEYTMRITILGIRYSWSIVKMGIAIKYMK